MLANCGEEKVIEKEVMHNVFHFYDEDESGFCVDEKIAVDSEKRDVAVIPEEHVKIEVMTYVSKFYEDENGDDFHIEMKEVVSVEGEKETVQIDFFSIDLYAGKDLNDVADWCVDSAYMLVEAIKDVASEIWWS